MNHDPYAREPARAYVARTARDLKARIDAAERVQEAVRVVLDDLAAYGLVDVALPGGAKMIRRLDLVVAGLERIAQQARRELEREFPGKGELG
jgi:hypothetical protein